MLLAGHGADSVVPDTASDDWEAVRRALETREISLSALLIERGLVLRADLLRPWAHWITPVQEARRFDTRFFVAALPEGQQARDVTGESQYAAWMRPAEAMAARERGELMMVPPTLLTLRDLAAHATTAGVLAGASSRVIRPTMPKLVPGGDGTIEFLVPGEPGYDDPEPSTTEPAP